MGKLRSIAGAARAKVKVRLRTGSRLERGVYHLVFSDAYRRERDFVSSGVKEYTRRHRDGELEFLLRRNIHMAEKGLTMRPRRETFATAYIEDTVTLASRLIAKAPAILSPEVVEWAREVLTRYFEATATSEHPAVVNARAAFAKIEWPGIRNSKAGPHAPFSGPAPVSINDLVALAERRKSVRWFTPTKVPREAIDQAMQVAIEAPTACNRQPFTFRVFDDPDMVAQVASIPMGTAGYAHNIPAITVIVGDLSAFIDERDRHLIYTDGCLAAMSFIFGLEAQGVASVCINWPDIAEREKRMAKLLNLSPHERVVMLVGLGYADESGHTPYSAKRSIDQLRAYNQF